MPLSSPPPIPATAVPAVVMVEEMQELLLAREEELTWREESLAAREEKVRISEKALAQVSVAVDAERVKAEATQQEYLNRIQAHTDCGKQVLDLDKMLGERKEELDGREQDLELRVAALAEAHAWGLNPWDNHDEPMEFIELRGLLWDVEADRVVEVSRLAALARDVSKVLEDLGMSPIPRIPRDPRTASGILGAVDVILQCMKEAYDLGHDP
jgi:hypothetical protein